MSQADAKGSGARIALLLSGNVLVVMLVAAINPALPGIERHFANDAGAGFLARLSLTAPALFVAVGGIAAGYLCNWLGRKPVLLGSIVGFAASGALCAFAPSIEILLLGRCLQGLFAAGAVTACTTLIGDYYQEQARENIVGLQGAAVSGSSMLFLLAGGVLATLDWRAPFYLYMASIVLLPFVWSLIVEPTRASPLPNAGSARIRVPASVLGFGIAASILLFVPAVHGPFLLGEMGVHDPRLIGVALAAMTGAGIATALAFAVLRARLGAWGALSLAMAAAAAGMLALSMAQAYTHAVAALVLVGIGMGLLVPGLNSLALAYSDERSRASAVGAVTASIFLGEFLSPLLTEAPRATLGTQGLFSIAGLICIVASILVAATLARPRPLQKGAQ